LDKIASFMSINLVETWDLSS